MTIFGDLMGLRRSVLNEVFGGVAGTYAQGSNTKTAGDAASWTRLKRNGRGEGLGIDEDEAYFEVEGAFFTSGFSGATPVIPTPGDTFTITGEKAWTVRSVKLIGDDWGVTCGRRRQKGQA